MLCEDGQAIMGDQRSHWVVALEPGLSLFWASDLEGGAEKGRRAPRGGAGGKPDRSSGGLQALKEAVGVSSRTWGTGDTALALCRPSHWLDAKIVAVRACVATPGESSSPSNKLKANCMPPD